MRHWAHHVRAGGLALALALLGNLAAPALTIAGSGAVLSQPMAPTQRIDIQEGDDGSLMLLANAPPAPAIYGSFKHFGLALSPAQRFQTPFRSLQIDYTATAPAGSRVRVDARVSADGKRWSGWEVDLASGARAAFDRSALFAQYQVTLLSNAASPSIRVTRVTPLSDSARYTAMAEAQPVAPTWKVHATRQGMIGGRTANGHRITKRDHFVSLPSWRALAPNGTNDYVVRITYNGRSSVAPVYDVGPWNAHDDYWNEQRQRYIDLPRGYPEDHAAYFDRYNGGRAEKGHVRFPTAIDIGDGVWWDDLGIKGDRAVVEVTFLWLGSDPPPPPAPAAAQAAPAPAPPAEIVADEHGADFQGQAKIKWYEGPKSCGTDGNTLWTFTTADAGQSENSGRWQPALPGEALYDVYVAIPGCDGRKPNTSSARYLIQHRDGTAEVTVDQAAHAGEWVLLGRFPFRGEGGFVELRDVAGDEMRTIWFDAVKWVRAP